jgi:hypothetical protein|tara:strand:+ start:165 stop:578 length:414 start_codon:yes stop_codon:yes gene_type:complete
MQIEYENRITSVRHTGPFVRIEGQSGQNTWGHFPITNPTNIDNSKYNLTKVYVSFRTREYGIINQILIYDGENIIYDTNDLSLNGNNLEYELILDKPAPISKGINLVLGFQFKANPPNTRSTQIEVIGVGIDLETNT